MQDLEEVAEKIKGVEDGVTNIIVPILKDTIKDSNLHNKRLFISNIALIVLIFIVAIIAMILSVYQNNRYVEFMSQFDASETIYQETKDNSSITRGINITK